MAKQLNIDLSVRANTTQAKQAMLELQKSLDSILTTKTITVNDAGINQAKQAAMDLKRHLDAATNVNTGKLDLSKFSASLNKSGQSLQGLYNELSQIGPQGQQAFLALSQSIAKADMSAVSLGSKLGGLATTLKNTAKWQISSSLLHGFMGAISGAYGYAQDLNESLNNIRIVTGQNVDEMAKFAVEANNSAKALSATTTEYTNASLIYYQQGLSDEEVKTRTDATIKLANVSRQSAEEVSNQMTAIWNNFAKGDTNLEYYADVITALGAATASSSEEIAEGLSKFASIADTVGLSYEKSSAALATVTAETRQSADVVGTAFRTMFARIQGLNLGKTLEDGVDLNKYSQALKVVGVNVLDSNSQLKNMDTILDELGEKWNSISEAQKVALSETVAGVRQYSQFMALMNNYDKIQQNQNLAEGSGGTLQKQADIYAESWEAARDRVKAAAQEIYDQLLNDEAFINILKGFETFLGFISNIIDGLGGLKGVLLLIGSIFMQQYAKEMPAFIEKMTMNVRILTGAEEKRRQAMLTDNAKIINEQMGKSGSAEVDMQVAGLKKVSTMYADLASKRSTLSEAEITSYENLIKETEARTQVAQAIGKEIDQLEKESRILEGQVKGDIGYKARNSSIFSTLGEENINNLNDELNQLRTTPEEQQDADNVKKLEQEKKEFDRLHMLAINPNRDLTSEEKGQLDAFEKRYGEQRKLNALLDQAKEKAMAFSKNLTGADVLKMFKEENQQLGKTQGLLNQAAQKANLWKKELTDAAGNQKAIKNIKEQMQSYVKEMEAAKIDTKGLAAEIDKLGTKDGNIDNIVNSFIDLQENGVEGSYDKISALTTILTNLGADPTKLDMLATKLQQGGEAAEQAKAELQGMAQSLTELPDHTMKLSEGLTKFGSAVMQVSMFINGLKNIGSIWSNEDISTGEKLLQTFTSLSMILPIVITLTNKQRLAELAVTAAKALHAVGAGGVTAAELAETSAKEASAMATWTLIWPIGVLMAAILALIGVIWLIVKAFEAWQKSTPEGQLKKAEENAKALADAANEAKNRAEELKSAFDSYHEVVEKLNACVKGTQEWKDTLQEVNTQVLDLIEKYPELAKYVTTDSDGVMGISREGEKLLTTRVNNAASTAQAASIEGNREVREKRINVIKSDMDKTSAKTRSGAGYSSGVGKTIRQYIEDNQDSFINMGDAQIRSNLTNYFNSKGITSNVDKWVASIKELTTAIKQDTEARKVETQTIVSNQLANNEVVQGSNNTEDILKASNQVYDSAIQEQLNELDEYKTNGSFQKGWGKAGISQAGSVNQEAKKVWQEYLDAAGMSNAKWKLTDTTGNDDNRVFVYTDENNEEKKVSLDQMRETRAAYLALEKLGQSAERITADFDKLSNSTNQTDEALKGFLTNKNFESSTAEEAAGITDFVTQDNDGNYNANSEQVKNYLTQQASALGYDSLEDMAKKYGYENGEKYIEAFTEQAENITKAWDDIDLESMGLSKTEGWAQNLSMAAAKKISDSFNKIKLGPMGESAAKEYISAIGDTLEGLNETDQVAALDALADINWSDYDAFEKLSTVMSNYGKTLDKNDPKWMKFIADMRRANSAIPDFSKLQEDLTQISKILGKINFGDTIEDEDYKKIIALHQDWEKFFIMQSDGTRKFIGDAEKMKQATQDSVREAKKAMAERKETQDEFKKDNSLNGINWGDQADAIRNVDSTKTTKISDKQIDVLNNSNVRKALTAQGYTNEDVERIVKNYNDNIGGKNAEAAKDAKEAYANLIQSIQNFSSETINSKEQQEALDEKLASTATNLNELQTLYNNAEISAKAYDKQLTTLAMSTSSLAELQNLQQQGMITNEQGTQFGLDTEEYSKALLNLAGNYDNCTNEILEYQKALASGSVELINETQAVLENAIAIGEMAEALDLETDKIEEQAKELISANNLTEEQYKVASKVAVLNQSMNKGVKELVDNWADYKKTLQSSEKGTEDYADAALKTKKALAQLLGVTDEEFIPDDFLEMPGVMDAIDKAIKGDEDAINSLGATMAKATIQAMAFKDGMKQLGENGIAKELSANQFEEYQNNVLNGINTLIEGITNGTIKAGEDISSLMGDTTTSWIESLNQMAYATGMSVEEMNSLLNELGVQADVTTKTKTVKTKVPQYETIEEVVSDTTGGGFLGLGSKTGTKVTRSSTRIVDYKEMDGAIEVAQINMGDKKGTPPSITYAGRDNVSSSALTSSDSKSSSSSDSSSQKNTSAASHQHEVNRYSNEENAINGLSKQYDRLSKAKDKAFGKGRIQALEQELQALKELKKASSNYLDAIVGSGNGSKVAQGIQQGKSVGSMIAGGQLGGTIAADYRSLFNGADASGKQVEYTAKDNDGNEWLASSGFNLGTFNSMFGTNLSFNLDSFGNIQNRDSILNLLQNLRNSESDAYSRIAVPSADSTTEYNKRIAYLDAIKERIEQYGETVETLGDKVEEYLDYISEIQEKNAEIISSKMEMGVDLGQKTVQRLERAIKILGDNMYKTAEGMSKWYDMTFKQGVEANKQQGDAYLQAMKETSDKVNLYSQPGGEFNENAIDPAHAAELFSQIEDGLDGLIDDVLEKIQQGKEFFGNALDYWNEKLNKVNTAIENNNKILSHFQNVLNLLGKSADYEALGKILQGISDNAKEDYAQRSRQFEDARQIYNSAKLDQARLERSGITGEALEQQKEAVAQALEDYQNKYDAMMTSAEAYIESINNITQNNINRIFAAAEDNLSGEWGSLDALDSAMKRHQSVADQYLTKTNQIYETNKLLRQIQQDIDKTDSKIAKDKLKNFSLEIDALKQREKLSKSSLEIAKAQYEMLQAQIALEEAQNAKTTVRLQRDNEGNYGYVYTADQQQVNDAEQNYADKENEYYNTLYRIQEEAGQRNIELRKEFLAELQSLQEAFYVNGTISEEEYNKQLADLKDTYRALEQVNQEDFLEASTLLNDVAAQGQTETWISSFDDIITKHRLFNDESATELDNYNTNTQSTADELTDKITSCLRDANAERERVEQETKMGNKDLQRSINEVTSSTKQLSDSVTKRGGLADSMNTAMNKALNLSSAFAQQYDSLQQLVNKYRNAADEVNTLYSRTVDLINAQVALNHANNGATSVSWGGGRSNVYSSNSGGSDSGNSSTSKGITPTSSNEQFGPGPEYAPWTYMWYDPETGRHTLIQKATGREFHVLPKDLYKYGFKSGGYTGTWVSGKTGLYTGSWNGPDAEENGKLAFLHQKELVLNAEDTENILDAVKLIRQISQSIDLQAISQASGWQLAAAQYSGSSEPLQQDITIHAEFPNAVDHNEIEQAFDNLANKAAQFANRS